MQWHGMCSLDVVTLFFHRVFGALVLDPEAYEDVERDRHAAMQSVIVVAAVCAAAGIGAMGLGAGVASVAIGATIALGGWLVWALMVITLGTVVLPEPTTHSDLTELLRVLSFAAAPGIFIAFAAMPSVAPLVLGVVAFWMIAAGVLGVRQALDYRSIGRAVTVCVISWVLSFGILLMIAGMMTGQVS
jgi:hypothetical protein